MITIDSQVQFGRSTVKPIHMGHKCFIQTSLVNCNLSCIYLCHRFVMGAFIGDKQLCEVVCSNKKDGRKEAADKALRALIASGQYNVETTVSLILSICTLKGISSAMNVEKF